MFMDRYKQTTVQAEKYIMDLSDAAEVEELSELDYICLLLHCLLLHLLLHNYICLLCPSIF